MQRADLAGGPDELAVRGRVRNTVPVDVWRAGGARGVFDTYGSDAMRWYLMASPILRGGNLIVNEAGIRDAVRQAILPLWNCYYFFALYSNAESYQARAATSSGHVLFRHAVDCAPGDVPGRRAAAATDYGGDLARPDRGRERAPGRLAGGR